MVPEDLIKLYNLKPHPEGGYYSETYRSTETIPYGELPSRFHGDRYYSTAIYYLLLEGQKSKFHRLASDELYHFYLGDPVVVVQLYPDRVEEIVVGPNVTQGEKLQHLIPNGTWFGAYPKAGSRFSLVGCTVAPGFDFADFEVADQEKMLREFPFAREMILRLT